jgi:glycine cleavage system H lipoate-binding protein
MVNRADRGTPEPCLWMSAGLLSYKLCDRGFDCDRCPLHAALRGVPLAVETRRRADDFPDDRLYSSGHTWLKPSGSDGRRYRLGLDCFATALIARPRRIRYGASRRVRGPGETVCEIELDRGRLSVGTPIRARPGRRNGALAGDPAAIVTAPYGRGWILELARADDGGLDDLVPAREAREQAQCDLRWFRRRVALELLSESEAAGPTLPDGGELITDLRQILGPARYLELLRDLVH